MGLSGLQIALDQMDGRWNRRALGRDIELGANELVYTYFGW